MLKRPLPPSNRELLDRAIAVGEDTHAEHPDLFGVKVMLDDLLRIRDDLDEMPRRRTTA